MRWDSISRQMLYDCLICLDEGWESRTYQQDGAQYMGQECPPEKAGGLCRARPCECRRGAAIAANSWRERVKHQHGAAALERLKAARPAYVNQIMAYLSENPDACTKRQDD